jgi:putative ABC transport system permease protein
MRSVEDITTLLALTGTRTNGTVAKDEEEANAGEILARIASINVGDEANITLGTSVLKAKIVGIVRTQTQSDTELLVTLRTAKRLIGNNSELSFIEFVLKEDVKENEVINSIVNQLPSDVKVIKTQQLKEFVQGVNDQTLTFLNAWSIAVYVTVAAASYMISTRLITDFNNELGVLRAIGAKKRFLFTTIQAYTITTILIGSILGIAVGLTGTQIVSRILTWIWHAEIIPFLEYSQALKLLLLTLCSSILGCTYPALRAAHLHQ